MSRNKTIACGLAVVLAGGLLCWPGCVNVHGLEDVSVDAGHRPRRIDTSRVPPTHSHEEARRRLAEAYERNRYLEHKVEKLEKDKRELKAERDEYKQKYKWEKKRNDD